MSDDTNEDKIEDLTLIDIAALAVATTLWLAREKPEVLSEIGSLADIIRGEAREED
jgi:hypothetical protein